MSVHYCHCIESVTTGPVNFSNDQFLGRGRGRFNENFGGVSYTKPAFASTAPAERVQTGTLKTGDRVLMRSTTAVATNAARCCL